MDVRPVDWFNTAASAHKRSSLHSHTFPSDDYQPWQESPEAVRTDSAVEAAMHQAEAHRNRAEMAEEEVFQARRAGEAALRQARDAAEQACADLRAALAAETKRANEALHALREAEERLGAERTLIAEQSQAALDEAISDWEAKAEEDARELERVINERDSKVAAAQAMLRAVEEQAEAEVTALRSDTKRQIEAERAASLAARAQAALLRKKLAVALYQLQQMRAATG